MAETAQPLVPRALEELRQWSGSQILSHGTMYVDHKPVLMFTIDRDSPLLRSDLLDGEAGPTRELVVRYDEWLAVSDELSPKPSVNFNGRFMSLQSVEVEKFIRAEGELSRSKNAGSD